MEIIKSLANITSDLYQQYPKDILNKDRKIKIKAAKLYLEQLVKEKQFSGDVDSSIRTLIGGKDMRVDWKDTIINELLAAGGLSEDSIFIKHKKGRTEMRRLIRYAEKRYTIELQSDGYYRVTEVV